MRGRSGRGWMRSTSLLLLTARGWMRTIAMLALDEQTHAVPPMMSQQPLCSLAGSVGDLRPGRKSAGWKRSRRYN